MSALLKALQDKARGLITESDAISAKDAPSPDEMTRLAAIVTELNEIEPQLTAAKAAESAKGWANQASPMLVLADTKADAEKEAEAEADPLAADRPMIKAFFTSRYKDSGAGAEQIAKEVYGDYEGLVWAKAVDFNRYLRTGQIKDERMSRALILTPAQIVNAASNGLSVKELKATMIEADDTLGGYVVPEDVRLQMIERLPGMTVVRSRANVITTGRDRVSFPRSTGGTSRYPGAVRVTWVDEQPTATESETNATLGQTVIPVHTVMATIPISRNLLEDSAVDLAGWLSRNIAGAFAIDEDEQFLTGDGMGKPQGLLNGTAANGAPFDADVTTVNSGAAAALTGDGVVALVYGLDAQYRGASVFVTAKASHRTIRQLKDGQGQYLWSSAESQMGNSPFGAPLLGFPVAESEAMPAVSANTYPLLFGNFSGYYIADRIGMAIERYLDSQTASLNQVKFIARRRLGGQVAEGWQFAAQKVAS